MNLSKTSPPSSRLGLLCASLALVGPRLGAEDAPSKITYDEHLVPILREKCFGCHNPDKERGGLSLNTYARLMEGGSSGEVVVAGDPDGSRLFLLVSHKEEPFMPPKSDRLPDAMLETVRLWIAGGALENAGQKAAPAKQKTQMALPAGAGARPEGPPPMPEGLGIDPVVTTTRPGTVLGVAASPWAPLVALAAPKQVLLYHAETLDLLGVLPFPEGTPHVVRFSRSGSLVLAGGGRGAALGRVVVWDLKAGARILEVGEELDAVLAADLSADQSRVALGGPSKVVRLFATDDGSVVAEIRKHTDWIRAVEFSPDGVLLATADRAGGLRIWEAQNGREYLTLGGHEAAITDVSWRPDSNVLASGGEDGSIRLWEMENGNQVKRWGAHQGGVLSVEFARDGRLVSAGRDRVVKVWKLDGTLERQFEAFADIATAAALTSDGSRVVGGDFTGEIRVWGAADGNRLGALALNPPSLASRVEEAGKVLASARADRERAAQVAEEARAEADRVAASLEAARKAAEDAARALAEKTGIEDKARAEVDRLSSLKKKE